MNFIAIASLRLGEDNIGIRLLDKNSERVRDFSNKQVWGILKNGYSIDNLRVAEESIDWIQGNQERYPVICEDTGEIINKNSIIVMGKYASKDKTSYLVINYEGKIAPIEEKRLIEYGCKYVIANCKVCSRNNNRYIAAIQGSFKILQNVKFRLDKCEDTLVIKILFEDTKVLSIPEKIDGKSFTYVSRVIVIPNRAGQNITHLILPRTIRSMHSIGNNKLYEIFPNITYIEFKGVVDYLRLGDYTKLKELKIKGIDHKRSSDMGVGSNSVERIEFVDKPLVYGELMFKDCINLDVSGLFHEGLLEIHESAFEGLNQLENIKLPKSLRSLHVSAFNGCKNIKTLEINNNRMSFLSNHNYNVFIYPNVKKLLGEAKDGTILCDYEYPKSILNKYVPKHINISRRQKKEDKSVGSRAIKASVLGMSGRYNEIVENMNEALGFLYIIDNDRYNKEIRSALEDSMAGRTRVAHISNGVGYMRIQFDKLSNYIGGRYRIKHTKNYAIVIGNIHVDIFLVSKQKLMDIIRSQVQGVNTKYDKLGEDIQYHGFGIKFPCIFMDPVEINMADIEEINNELILITKHGECGKIAL